MSEPFGEPEIDRYAAFVLTLPEDERRRLGRLLENLATRDEGGWLIVGQTADDFLRRHREYLRTIVESEYYDAFHAED